MKYSKNIPEIEIKYKTGSIVKQKITNSKDAFDIFKQVFDADTIEWKEECILLCLNTSNCVIGWYKVSSGGTTMTVIDPKVIFSVALTSGATAIMMAHNHPSGALIPSISDINITKKIQDGAKILDIILLDHLIITNNEHYSFADNLNVIKN